MKNLFNDLNLLCHEYKDSIDKAVLYRKILDFLPNFYSVKESFKDVAKLFQQHALDEFQIRAENIYYGYRAAQVRDSFDTLSNEAYRRNCETLRKELDKTIYGRIFCHYLKMNSLLRQIDLDEEFIPLNSSEQKHLLRRLAACSWENRAFAYSRKIKALLKLSCKPTRSSVIIISNNEPEKMIAGLRELHKQKQKLDYKIIFVSNKPTNHNDEIIELVDTFIIMNDNSGAYLARNIGSIFSSSDILIFMDDDGVPDQHFVAKHEELHKRNIAAARGACLSASNGLMPEWYWLGIRTFPCPTNLEGNCSFKSRAFYPCGGWGDYILFGGGGLEICYRMLNSVSTPIQHIYSPEPIIFHDYCIASKDIGKKRLAQHASWQVLKFSYPDLHEIHKNWIPINDTNYSVQIIRR